MQIEELKVSNQKMLENLTASQNKERALKEKNEHLTIDLRKLETKMQFFEEANINVNSFKEREVTIRNEM
jgi:hypothetical protein